MFLTLAGASISAISCATFLMLFAVMHTRTRTRTNSLNRYHRIWIWFVFVVMVVMHLFQHWRPISKGRNKTRLSHIILRKMSQMWSRINWSMSWTLAILLAKRAGNQTVWGFTRRCNKFTSGRIKGHERKRWRVEYVGKKKKCNAPSRKTRNEYQMCQN